jgi:hypothetical protein
MTTATRRVAPPGTEPTATAGRGRLVRVAAAAAGPVLIVAAILVVYRAYVFHDLLSSEGVDMLAFYLPNYCFLGKTLAAGHIALWNPYTMGGAPFAADPVSGWMNLSAMLVFGTLPCTTAMRMFIVLQPIIAGLGMYWFLRGESLSRAAATAGSLILVSLVGSTFGSSLAFAGIVAWLPILLGAVSRCFGSATWPKRLVWCLVAAIAWGQAVASFFTNGFVLGTGALVLYGVGRTIIEVRAGRLGKANAMILWAVVLAAIPTVNLAFLLPRFVYLAHSTIALGYDGLKRLEDQLSHLPSAVVTAAPGGSERWILNIIGSPRTYLWVLPLMLSFAAWASRSLRERRPIIAALSAFGAIAYLFTIPSVGAAFAQLPISGRLASLVQHGPNRNMLGVVVAASALAGFGLQGWLDGTSLRERALMLAPGLAFWAIVPLAVGARVPSPVLAAVAVGVGMALLVATTRWRSLVVLIPVLVAVELFTSAAFESRPIVDPKLLIPRGTAGGAAYLQAGPIVRALQSTDGRYLGFDPRSIDHRGYLVFGLQSPDTWGLLVNQRAMLFELQDVQGYSSVQLPRYWSFVRALTRARLDYNAAVFPQPSRTALDLLQVNSVVARASSTPDLPLASKLSVEEGPWALYTLDRQIPRVSILSSWQVVGSDMQALQVVTGRGFDPAAGAVLERSPGIDSSMPSGVVGAGSATYQALGLQSARITLSALSPVIVLVRNVYDPHWSATLDGRPVPVLAADYLVQGIPVPPGRHVIVVSYEDPTIGQGLAGTGLSTALLLGGALVLAILERRRPFFRAPEGDGSPAG